jgi:hypothetical protein
MYCSKVDRWAHMWAATTAAGAIRNWNSNAVIRMRESKQLTGAIPEDVPDLNPQG